MGVKKVGDSKSQIISTSFFFPQTAAVIVVVSCISVKKSACFK